MKFFFVVSDFNTGGITSSLKHLSGELILRGHSVDILNLPNALRSDLPFHCSVNLIPLKGKAKYWGIGIQNFQKAKGMIKLLFLAIGIIKKVLNKFGQWERFIFSGIPIYENYDAAIAYRQSSICYFIIQKKVKTQKKIAFIHSEFDGDCSSWVSYLSKMDYVVCPSISWSDLFSVTFPKLKSKVRTVYNIFDPHEILKKSDMFFPNYDQQMFIIVTVSRIEFSPKRLNWIPLICQILSQKTSNFKWFIIGDGPDREKLNQIIWSANVSEYVTLLGSIANPYPYIKHATLFVLVSEWESYGMVIQEAMILNTPIVATDYPALHEIMRNGEHGIITENSIESVANAVIKMMTEFEAYNLIKEKCRSYQYSKDIAYKQFMKLCN